MEEKYYEKFVALEKGLENEGYIELKREMKKNLKELNDDNLINMYYRVKLKLNKQAEEIVGAWMQPIAKHIFTPVSSVLLTLITVLFAFFNGLGDIFYQAGMETGESVLNVVDTYGIIMKELYGKGMRLLVGFFVVIIFIYAFAYFYDNIKQQKMKMKKLYYKFILEVIEEVKQKSRVD